MIEVIGHWLSIKVSHTTWRVFFKHQKICQFIYFEKCTVKTIRVLLLCTQISLFLIFFPRQLHFPGPWNVKYMFLKRLQGSHENMDFWNYFYIVNRCVLQQYISDVNDGLWPTKGIIPIPLGYKYIIYPIYIRCNSNTVQHIIARKIVEIK